MSWKEVAKFLETYGNAEYKAVSKCFGEDRKRMEQLRSDAQMTLQEFERLALRCCENSTEMILLRGRNKNFLDGTMRKIRPYVWERFAIIDAVRVPVNISVFCESAESGMQARVAIDVDLKKTSLKDLSVYNKTLLCAEKPENSIYLANTYGNKGLEKFGGTGSELLSKIALKEYKKAEIAYVFPIAEMDDEDITAGMQTSVNALIPIYKSVISAIK